jgi:hypothetical protein
MFNKYLQPGCETKTVLSTGTSRSYLGLQQTALGNTNKISTHVAMRKQHDTSTQQGEVSYWAFREKSALLASPSLSHVCVLVK